MVSETAEPRAAEMPHLQIVDRVGSLPVVMTAIQQLGVLYGYTKQSNSFVKYGLETAESGLKLTSVIASPMVSRWEKPVNQLDMFAVGQMEKLEQCLPILTKPTPQVMEEAGYLYNATLGPTVDKLVAATKYMNMVERIQGAATYGKALGQSGVDTVHQVTEANRQGAQTLTNYSKAQVAGLTAYSGEKLNQLMATKYGQVFGQQVDSVLERSDIFLDYYLPAEENEAKVQPAAPASPGTPLTRASQLSRKAGQRLYSRGVTHMEKLVMRSAETASKLTFTLDLLDYAKTHLDSGRKSLQDGLVYSKDKAWSVWEQVNRTEEQVLNTTETSTQQTTMESRLIASARHLTSNLKRSFDSLSSSIHILPESLQNTFTSTLTSVHDLYNAFANMKTVNDVQTITLSNGRSLVANIQTLSVSMLSFMETFVPALNRLQSVPEPSIEMEEPTVKETENTGNHTEELNERKKKGDLNERKEDVIQENN